MEITICMHLKQRTDDLFQNAGHICIAQIKLLPKLPIPVN